MFTDNQIVTEMDKLFKFAMRLTRNNADAEDLLQNTVLRAYEKKHLFNEGSNVFSWTSKIMYHIFVSQYRRKVKFETQYDPDSYMDKQSIAADQDDKMMLREVGAAMQRLSPEHQEILVMVCVQGMQYEETANALNIPVGTVRSRLSRARTMLQTLLDQSTEDERNITAMSVDRESRIAA